MTKRTVYWIPAAGLLAVLGSGVLLAWWNAGDDFAAAVAVAVPVDRRPSIRPDYSDAVIPPNIAPLNFVVQEPGAEYRVRIRADRGKAIDVASRSARIAIPLSRWKRLLDGNRGGKLYFDVCVRQEDGRWTRFEPIENTIADADIDAYLFYRLIKPIYIIRVDIALMQRNVETFEESVLMSNRTFSGGCINCHTFAPNHPDRMIVQSRGSDDEPHWNGMIVARQGEVVKVDTRTLVRDDESDRGRVKKSLAAYAAWHPNGQVVAYSANKISQFFHTAGENRDVFDAESDLALYHVDSNTVTTAPSISQPDRLETFPTWSPDGRHLYFCSTDPLPMERYEEVRYDLMRAAYNPDSGEFGDAQPVLLAEDTGLSITEPRVSPDGRWVLFCMSNYGAFPVYQPSSDLYLMDLQTKQYRRLDINSPRCESWHSWSSNSRWFAFASKRRDGVFARIYFSYVDEKGRAHKPVVLPQQDPTFYDRFIRTYNTPELARTPAPVHGRPLARAVRSAEFSAPTNTPDRKDCDDMSP